MDEPIRRIIREELRSVQGNNFREAPRPQFNSRGDFGRANRTTNGQIICHNCKRVGHHFRNCRSPNYRQSDYRQNGFRSNDQRQNDPRIPNTQHNPRAGFVRSSGRPFQRDNSQSN